MSLTTNQNDFATNELTFLSILKQLGRISFPCGNNQMECYLSTGSSNLLYIPQQNYLGAFFAKIILTDNIIVKDNIGNSLGSLD